MIGLRAALWSPAGKGLTSWLLFVLLLYVKVNSYGHGGRSVDLTTLFPGQA